MRKKEDLNLNNNEKENIDKNSDPLHFSLPKIAGKAVLVFVGVVLGMSLAFIGRVFFARFFTPAEYGIFSLGLSLLGIATAIGTLGLRDGTTRQISYYLGKNDKEKVDGIIKWSLIFGLIGGIAISLIVFISAD